MKSQGEWVFDEPSEYMSADRDEVELGVAVTLLQKIPNPVFLGLEL